MGKVISTNIGEKVTIIHNGVEKQTGIYKYTVNEPIFLGQTDVEKDHVMDRKYHGGIDKACYLYPSENYDYWQKQFPSLKMEWGMFGENLTTEGFIERTIRIGTTYQIGEAIVQVSQPRQPCYKLGIRFNDPKMVKLFSNAPYPGIYVRVLNEGFVKAGDSMVQLNEPSESLVLTDVFALLMKRNNNKGLMMRALSDPFLAASAKKDLAKLSAV
ncbi:MAG: MOSC domain-containing protein [Prolixibacteraceae bacterium]